LETREDRSSGRTGRTVTLQISSGALVLAGLLIGLLSALAIAAAFLAGMVLRSDGNPAAPQIITVVAVLPTEPPALSPVAASSAYPAPAGPADVAPPEAPATTDDPPVFAPVRPTAAQPRGFSTTDVAAPAPTVDQPDFQIVPPGTPPAPTIGPPVPSATPQPTVVQPTVAVLPTEAVAPTVAANRESAANRSSGDEGGSSQPTSRPAAHEIRGNQTWGPENGPIVLRGDINVGRGSTLIIREGVDIQIPRGVSIVVDGNFFVLGSAARPVRIAQIGGDRSQRWEGIFARPGSSIAINNALINGGGAGGTLLGAELSDIKLRSVRLIANGGQLRMVDSRVDIRELEMYDNEIPYGAAIDATFSRGGAFTLTNSRLVRNGLAIGAAPVLVTSQNFEIPTTLEITGNLLAGQDGPNLQLFTNAQMQGNITCNTLVGGANGLSLRSDGPPNLSPMINLRDNAIEGHTPPIIDIYLEFGIGRGATSDLPLGMANNWWELPNGPYEPDRNNEGRGESVGENVTFAPWLTARPACTPQL
jgi:hypothetical protein